VTKAQLEEPGYLDPGDRGNRADEREVIEKFLTDSLARPRQCPNAGVNVLAAGRRKLATSKPSSAVISSYDVGQCGGF